MCINALGRDWIDAGTLARARSYSPADSSSSSGDLTADEKELLLDIGQIVLDLVGIIDPTPTADGTNMLISVSRSDWIGAGISGIALIPYIGDLAKSGKLAQWSRTIEKAIMKAKSSPQFSARIHGPFMSLIAILDGIPSSSVPSFFAATLARFKRELRAAVGLTRPISNAKLIDHHLKIWNHYIDKIQLPVPGKNRGALWSKLDAKPFTADDASIKGYDLAARLARQDGRKTLEMALDSEKFLSKYSTAEALLAEKLGVTTVWKEFGVKIWERISLKYVATFEGRVTVYVDDEVLKDALRKNQLPILSKELQELLRRKREGLGITEIVVKDIFDGTVFVL